MFDTLEMAPADPILGLTEAFKADPNPDKINLSVGVYLDGDGRTPILSSVKKAEERDEFHDKWLKVHAEYENTRNDFEDTRYNRLISIEYAVIRTRRFFGKKEREHG